MADVRLVNASSVHIFTAGARSGIAAYAADFQEVVLGPEGYVQAEPDAVLAALNDFAPDTKFHVQLGVFQHRERLAMSGLLKSGYGNVEATIHDPPFTSFPFFQFHSTWLMRLSRGFDWYFGSFGIQRRSIERLTRVVVLSERGRTLLQRSMPKAKVVTIPHVVKATDVWSAGSPLPPALIYFGFIGPQKGLEYVLDLHREVMKRRPGTRLHVVGQAVGEAGRQYLAELRALYSDGVTFHGYVPDDRLDEVFERAAHVILPYAAYKHIMPASGSIVHALRRARVVWTTDVNAVSELIYDGKNGFMLSHDIERDAQKLSSVMADEAQSRAVSDGARCSAMAMADYPYRRYFTQSSR